MPSVDVAVVGAGVIGLAVAHELAARGSTTVVLEKRGIGAGASGVQPGGVRQQWGTRIGCRLARESITFWDNATERLQSPVPLTLERCGYLFVAFSADTLASLAGNVGLQNEEGVPSRLVSPDEIADLVPGLQTELVRGGAWCATDGYFDRPQSVVEAFARGLDVRYGAVLGLRRHRGIWTVRLEDREELEAGAVVVAAGVESVPLLSGVGFDLPVVAEDRYLFLSEPLTDRLLEPLVVASELAFAAKQLTNGRVLASDLGARGDPATGHTAWRAHIRESTEQLLPLLTYVSYPVLVPGVYDVSPDHQPAVGPIPGHDGLFVAAGFSGHGFMIAPAVARLLADVITGVRDEALDALDPGRFGSTELIPESQLV